MDILSKLNGVPIYAICGGIIAIVALVCVIFMVRAYKAGKAMGMDTAKLKKVIISSASFSVLPAVAILIGVITLSGSLGTPWPWLRLSVVGALHYETQVAEAAAEQVGMSKLSISEMTASGFTTIALLMSVCIMWGMVLSLFFNKGYTKKLSGKGGEKKSSGGGFGDRAMAAMFIGLVCAYIGSYIGSFVSGSADPENTAGGLFAFKGDWMPLVVVAVSGISMAFFTWLSKKKHFAWVEEFALAGSMLIGMGSVVLLNLYI